MAIKIETISGWLDEVGAIHQIDDNNIVFGMADNENDAKKSVVIQLHEGGEIFQMYMNLLDDDLNKVCYKDHQHLQLILTHVLHFNYQKKFGTWEYDPKDGEIRLAVEIPIEDGTLTHKQFQRIFYFFTRDGQQGFEDIMKIAESGVIPENDDAESLLQMLEALRSSFEKEAEIENQKKSDILDGI